MTVSKKRRDLRTSNQTVPEELQNPLSADREAFAREFSEVKPLAVKNRRIYARELPEVVASTSVRFRILWSEDRRVIALREGVSEEVLRRLRNRRCGPSAALDLHGMRVCEVADQVVDFVRNRYLRGFRVLLIVHGKGRHSDSGVGVLGEEVVKALTEGRSNHYIRAITTAADRMGGQGALVVQLIP